MKNNLTRMRSLSQGALIAALYVVLTLISNILGLASGVIQLRLSEILCVLPLFTGAAVPGLFVGCILANTLSGCALWDVVFGSIATLIGALGTALVTRLFRRHSSAVPLSEKRHTILAVLPPVLANTLTVPFILTWVYGAQGSLPFFFLTVFLGEAISCGVGGWLLHRFLCRYGKTIHWA